MDEQSSATPEALTLRERIELLEANLRASILDAQIGGLTDDATLAQVVRLYVRLALRLGYGVGFEDALTAGDIIDCRASAAARFPLSPGVSVPAAPGDHHG